VVVVALLVSSSVSLAAKTAPATVTWSPSISDYGDLAVGASASQAFTLANTGGKATRALTVTLTGAAAFAITADTCAGTALGPGKSCQVTVAYSPVASGDDSATLRVSGTKPAVSASVVVSGSAAAAGHIYWSNANIGTIRRADLDGSNPDQHVITGAYTNGLAVDVDHVYWTDSSSTIGRADLDGSNPDQTFITGVSSPLAMAVDADHIYWTNNAGGTIGRADLDGSNPDPSFIITDLVPYGIAVGN
jgi:hypothetical protein